MMASTQKPETPVRGQMYYDREFHTMMQWNGACWIPVEDYDMSKRCVVCKRETHQVDFMDRYARLFDHPFCSNNLEYLEWLQEKKERARYE